jgi:hypothetical protein
MPVLMAPGEAITSSVPNAGYESWNGTSMATPHVAGAWAIMKQRANASVDTILNTFKNTGLSLYDSYGGATFKRIRIKAALDSLLILTSPADGTTTSTGNLTFQWTDNTNISATTYRLLVSKTDGTTVFQQDYTSSETGCSNDTSCEITPTLDLGNNTYRWYIKASNALGSAWSRSRSFKLGTLLSSPNGTTTSIDPTFQWTGNTKATQYTLWVGKSDGTLIFQKVYNTAETGCSTDTSCEITVGSLDTPLNLGNGTYRWYINSSDAGGSAWSARMDFAVGSILTAPSGAITTGNPAFQWTGNLRSTYYKLWLGTADGSPIISKWYSPDDAGCSSDTSCEITLDPLLNLSNGSYNWYVKSWDPQGSIWSARMGFTLGSMLIAPNDTITTGNPTFQWTGNLKATHYKLWIGRADGTTLSSTWYSSEAAGCGTDTSCEVTPASLNLSNGTYRWSIQSMDSGGSVTTGYLDFTVGTVLTSPGGTATTRSPTFQWTGNPISTYYKLWVGKADGTLLFSQWYSPADAGCSTDLSCEVTLDTPLNLYNGAYRWFIKSWDSGGSAWSGGMEFTIDLPAEWTVMIYLAADNSFENAAITDFLKMASIGSNANINIMAQFDRSVFSYATSYGDWKTTKRFYITKDMTPTAANALSDLGELNMGAEATLQDFITWAKAAYPANHYALILWGGGEGWHPRSPDDPLLLAPEGISWDNGDYISNIELSNVLDAITTQGANKLDLLGLDAPYMATIEVDYHLSPYAVARASSQKTGPIEGWPYDTILADLTANPTWTGQQLADDVATRYYAYVTEAYSQSALRFDVSSGTSYFTDLVNAVETLANAMIANMAAEKTNIASARLASYQFSVNISPYINYIDLYDFASELKNLSSNTDIDNACDGVMNTITAAISNNQADDTAMHGITIYFPRNANNWTGSNKLEYTTYQYFARDTHWDEFLDLYFTP